MVFLHIWMKNNQIDQKILYQSGELSFGILTILLLFLLIKNTFVLLRVSFTVFLNFALFTILKTSSETSSSYLISMLYFLQMALQAEVFNLKFTTLCSFGLSCLVVLPNPNIFNIYTKIFYQCDHRFWYFLQSFWFLGFVGCQHVLWIIFNLWFFQLWTK